MKLERGPAQPELVEQGWRTFLVKVTNEAGVTARFNIRSPNALPLAGSPEQQVVQRWLDILPFTSQPMSPTLSGLGVEYRVVSLYSRDAGKREAKIAFNVGQGTQDLGFRNDVDILFTAEPAARRDAPRAATRTASPRRPRSSSATRRAASTRPQAKRLAPDFAFHPQVYRADGETVQAAGRRRTRVESPAARNTSSQTRERRRRRRAGRRSSVRPRSAGSIPSQVGWWSGDHHIHAAGCAHYTNPTEGVLAADMMRHCLGEDLKVGCNLTWGPCFDYQKQFFTGEIDKVSQYPVPAALRRRGLRLRLAPVRPPLPAAPEGADLSRRRLRQALADALPEHAAWAKKQGAVVRPGPLRLGPGGRRPPTCRTTSSRPTTASAPTSTSSMSPTRCPAPTASSCRPSISCPRSTRRTCGS